MKRRKERLEHEIRIIISDIFLKDIKDPRIGFITINDVELTSDLKHAKVFVSVYGNEEEKEKSMNGLQSATKHIQGLLAHKLSIKNVPFIQFFIDESIEKGVKLTKVIEELTKEETEN
jgi:ribosome-binding factor A